MRGLRLVAVNALICVILCGLCIGYVDAPVAWFVHQTITNPLAFQIMAAPSLLALPLALVFLIAAALNHAAGKPELPHHGLLLRLSLATLAATTAKDELKWVIGRSWPGALINHGIYGFAPFTDSPYYGSFPSGHTSYIAAPLLMFAILKPKYTPISLVIIALVMVGLVGGGYHYPADTIAGLFTGLASAAGVGVLMRGR
ncbi:MAG: phosphatase PAP2 family protein [Acidocella sp.]|nr:phosphatase PAP2 family protein [Acidocella sp.]